jgi:hypothetical protein
MIKINKQESMDFNQEEEEEDNDSVLPLDSNSKKLAKKKPQAKRVRRHSYTNTTAPRLFIPANKNQQPKKLPSNYLTMGNNALSSSSPHSTATQAQASGSVSCDMLCVVLFCFCWVVLLCHLSLFVFARFYSF